MGCEVRSETKDERVLAAAVMVTSGECQQVLRRLSLAMTDLEVLQENGMSSTWVCQEE
jgi:hypothetical protein